MSLAMRRVAAVLVLMTMFVTSPTAAASAGTYSGGPAGKTTTTGYGDDGPKVALSPSLFCPHPSTLQCTCEMPGASKCRA